ncbi:hypothetical protein [Hyphomonas chukchiensis]|uniref:hypothetical protein n=1 Tax=Hyphomonas chukchiensis TaxID=1280947 RepID=UPI0030FCE405
MNEARRTVWAKEARALSRSVLADDPANADTHGFLAIWNIEIVRRGGTLGGMMRGAGIDDVRDYYKAAVTHAPGEASEQWQYARSLSALNAKKYRAEFNAALAAAAAAPVETAL